MSSFKVPDIFVRL